MKFSDRKHLEEIANRPHVFSKVALRGQTHIGLDGINGYFIDSEHGGFVFNRLAECIYEVHTLIDGGDALQLAKEAALMMFTHTPCMEIYTKVPDSNTAAKKLTEKMEFIHQYHRDNAFDGVNGMDGADFYRLPVYEWIVSSDECVKAGHRFHKMQEDAGIETNHGDDPVHDAFAGFALLCSENGIPEKSIYVYNLWAQMNGFVPLSVLEHDPLRVDIGNAILTINGAVSVEKKSCQ